MPYTTDAPGLKPRRNKDGSTIYYWVASNCSRKAEHYSLKTVRLADQSPGGGAARSAQCQELHMELQLWLNDMDPRREFDKSGFDGTVSSLVRYYRDHPHSPYRELKYNTQIIYDQHLDIIRDVVGKRRLGALTGVDFISWYKNFSLDEHGKEKLISRAHKLMNMFRIIVSWGVVLELPHSPRIRLILSEMKFTKPPPRTVVLTYDHAVAIIEKAHQLGQPSIALAQALQFEFTLRQKDVVGEWLPDGEEGIGAIMVNGKRWANGLLWNHIGQDGILRKITTKTGAEAVFEVARYPLVVKELARWAGPKVGPLVVDEKTGIPYQAQRFVKRWRQVADAAGVPREVFNMDSRAGGITEATDAGASLEVVRHHATHRDIRTTTRYSRSTLTKTQAVADIRSASRNKPKT